MKSTLGIGVFVTLAMLMIATAGFAQNQQEGIVVKEERAKTIVYQIKLVGLSGTQDAEQLDAVMATKEGIIASETQAATRVCTVEAMRDLRREDLREIVEYSGLRVAKSFTD